MWLQLLEGYPQRGAFLLLIHRGQPRIGGVIPAHSLLHVEDTLLVAPVAGLKGVQLFQAHPAFFEERPLECRGYSHYLKNDDQDHRDDQEICSL